MSRTYMQGILLIGMPYAGKSTIGRKVAKELGFEFFDGDTEIEKICPNRQEYLDMYGDSDYIKMESRVIIKLPTKNSVLAPGGSIIYSKKVKKYLHNCFKVYLNAPLNMIKKRITSADKRGIVRLKKLGLESLYSERSLMFKSYCDVEFDTDIKNPDELSKIIVNDYSIRQLVKKNNRIQYKSTNGKSKASFSEALSLGLAPDKGLFVPDKLPYFSKEDVKLMKNLNYAQLAFVLLRQFVDISDDLFYNMCKRAYNFSIPIEHCGNICIARLDQGPSASFKDFAMQLLAQMIEHAARKKKKKLVIITATSGDTGGAVASAFSKIKNVKAVILMPEKEITEIQRRQMTTTGDKVVAILVNGKFDDCQALAKKALLEIKELSSANSINIGRLLPQLVYYFYVYCRTGAGIFVVPSGNFGNLAAGIMAKRMGLPIKFVAAVNENDEFPRFLKTGKYRPIIPSRKCISNAMNVGNPSNLARLVYFYGGRLTENGDLVKKPDIKKLNKYVKSCSITDEETRKAMEEAYNQHIILEPHGAVGWAAIEKLKLERKIQKIALFETAHPSKFPEEIDALGIQYEVPHALLRLKNLKEKYLKINPEFEDLKNVINKLFKQS